MSFKVEKEKDKNESKEKVEKEAEIVDEKQEQKQEPKEVKKDLAEEYLNLARVVQADFDNYRKRSIEQVERARVDGIVSTVEVLLPSLDAFKKAKENIKEDATLKGIEMLERAIQTNLEKLGVEKIEAIGLPLNPNVHNVLAVTNNPKFEDGVVVEEFQTGYKFKDKIIRCSQVLVNKLEKLEQK